MCKKPLLNLLSNKYVRFAGLIFLAGFFLGYTMRLFDFINAPIFSTLGVIYPIHNEARFYSYVEMGLPEERVAMMTERFGTTIDVLYVMKNNVVSPFILITTGVIFALPGVVMTFLVGISIGTSIPEVIEFLGPGLMLKTIFASLFYVAAIILAASIGFEIGESMIRFMRKGKFKVSQELYNRSVILILLIILNILIQYFLLVVR